MFDVLVVNAEKRFQASWWKLDLLQLTILSPGCLIVGRMVRAGVCSFGISTSRTLLHGTSDVNRVFGNRRREDELN